MEERVQKIIANSGYCSRRKAEEFISRGKVRVNGNVIKLGDKAEETDEIYVDSYQIKKAKPIYIMMNKPKGYEVTLNNDVKNIFRLIDIEERVIPVGRLDRSTTGLILLTNDGDFANKMTHPRYEKEKTYLALLDKKISERDFDLLNEGVHLMDGYVKPKVKLINKDRLEITIHEGRKWIIKRMLFKLGYYVKDLTRVRIGNLKLDVKLGRWRYLTRREVDELLR